MRIEERVGQNIPSWRSKRGLTQEELAHRADLHPTYLSGVETGSRNPTLRVLSRLATALNIDPVELFHANPRADD